MAETALLGFASIGLFPRHYGRLSTKQVLDLRLADLAQESYRIRTAGVADVDSLYRIEQQCWAPELQQPREALARRLAESPNDNFVAVVDDAVVGVVYSRRIKSVAQLVDSTFSSPPPLATSQAYVRQMIAIAVLPEYAPMRLGTKLRDLVLQISTLASAVTRVAAMSRCSDFPGGSDEEYERHVCDDAADATLKFHRSGGATCMIVHNYRPEDRWNNGHGVLVTYTLEDAAGAIPDARRSRTNKSVDKALASVLGVDAVDWQASCNRTWMELGMTSLDFSELAGLLGVEETLLFDYTTPARLEGYLADEAATVTHPTAAAPLPTQHLQLHLASPNVEVLDAACQLPGGAGDATAFWSCLLAGQDCIVGEPEGWQSHFEGGFLQESAMLVDIEAFGISTAEADQMDPHQAVLLDACCIAGRSFQRSPRALEVSAGLFVAFCNEEWPKSSACRSTSAYTGTGQSRAIAAGRISYHLNFVGPALVADTACSSSLAALHLARRALLCGDCGSAVTAAVDLMLTSHALHVRAAAGMLSKDHRCKTFDKRADGYGRGEGVEAFALRVSGAQSGEDGGGFISAEVCSARLNQNAHSASLTAPCGTAQQAVIAAALQEASVTASNICYVESHGTGTALGDPIEFGALCAVLSECKDPLVVGALKTNLGHLEGAAGYAGLLKACAVLQMGEVPANLHFQELSPLCQAKALEVVLPTESVELQSCGESFSTASLHCGVSSFGFSGTNGHAVLKGTPKALTSGIGIDVDEKGVHASRLGTTSTWRWHRLEDAALFGLSDEFGLMSSPKGRSMARQQSVNTVSSEVRFARQNSANSTDPDRTVAELLRIVQGAVAEVLPGLPTGLGQEEGLLEMGLDSLSAIELSHLLRARIPTSQPGTLCHIPSSAIMREPTLQGVARVAAEAREVAERSGHASQGLSPDNPLVAVAAHSDADADDPTESGGATFPTSLVQQGMLFHVLSASSPELFLETFMMDIQGDINMDALVAAWARVVALVPQFRACFDIPCQLTQTLVEVAKTSTAQSMEDPKPDFVTCHNTFRGTDVTLEQIRAFAMEDRRQGLSLKDAPLLRVHLLPARAARTLMVVTIHHLVIDGWSWGCILRLLQREYAIVMASAGFSASVLHLLEVCTNSAAEWLSLPLELPSLAPVVAYEQAMPPEAALSYWSSVLMSGVGVKASGSAAMHADLSGREVLREIRSFSSELSSKMLSLARGAGVTVASVIYAAWYLVQSSELLKNRSDVVMGCTTSRRSMPIDGIDAVVGPVVNTVPLRLDFAAGTTIAQALRSTHSAAIRNSEHDWVPLGQLQEALGTGNLLDIVVDVQQDIWSCVLAPAAVVSCMEYLDVIGVPLSVRILLKPDQSLQLTMVSETSSCLHQHLTALADALTATLQGFVEDSEATLGELRTVVFASTPHGCESTVQGKMAIFNYADEVGPDKVLQMRSDVAHHPSRSDEADDSVEALLRQCLGEVLGSGKNIMDIPADANLFSAGLDSLRSLRFTAVAMRHGLHFSIRDIFENPTLARLRTKATLREGVAVSKQDVTATSPLALFKVEQPEDEGPDRFPLIGITKAYWTGLWHNPYSPKGCFPQIAFEFDWQGGDRIDVPLLSRCFDSFVQRHACFRAVVTRDSPMMRYLVEEEIQPVHFEEQLLEETEDVAAACDAAYHDIFEERIDPCTFPLFRGRVLHLPAARGGGSRFFYCVSLFVMDGITDLTWRSEISDLYRRRALSPKPALTYKAYNEAYVAEGTGIKCSVRWKTAAEYWRRRVQEGLPLPPQLPTCKECQSNQGTFSHYGDAPLSALQLQRLKEKAAAFGLTPTAVLLSLYCLALARHAASSKMLINVLHCLRHHVHEDCERVLGNFSSSFLCPVDVSTSGLAAYADGSSTEGNGQVSILAAARSAMESLVDCQAQNAISGVDVMSMVNSASAEPGRPAAPFIFVSAMGLEAAVPEWQDLCFTERRVTESTSGTFMVHAVKEYPDGSLYAGFNVIDGAFPDETLRAVVADHRRLLEVVTADVSEGTWRAPISNVLPAIEIPAAIRSESTDVVALSSGTLLQDGLLRGVEIAPESNAVADPKQERVLSYGELHMRSLSVAVAIDGGMQIDAGLARHLAPLMAVASEKGWQQIVACMAILLRGCAYLPLNIAAWPQMRVESVLAAGEVVAILTSASALAMHPWLSAQGVPSFDVDALCQGQCHCDVNAAWTRQPGHSLAYCIFTSGSTGRPKGVAMTHAGALNTIHSLCNLHGLSGDLVTFGVSQLAFDLSVSDIFLTFHAGGTLVLPPEDSLSPPNPQQWGSLAEQFGVTLWNSVPALFGLLCEHCELFQTQLPRSMRLVWLSGDVVPEALPARAQALASNALRLYAMGGATEAGIWSNIADITHHSPLDGIVPYGNALPGQGMHVVRLEDWQPAATGVPGMIAITGGSLMLGYYNDDLLTGKAIVTVAGQRMYLTQDAGYTRRRQSDGQLECIITGRIQGNEGGYVKVRGYRVELQEVETALRSSASIRSAAVTVLDRSNIVAYVVLADGSTSINSELDARVRDMLSSVLPSYAIPRWIIPLEKMPLSSNGKVDKSALPVPDASIIGMGEAKTGRDAEPAICSKEEAAVLEAAQSVGIRVQSHTENIFSAGADSVAALRLVLKLEAANRVKLEVGAIFSDGSIAALAAALQSAAQQTAAGMELRRDVAKLEMSVLQQVDSLSSHQQPHPVFLCHGAGTTALALTSVATALAHTGEFGTVYGISDTFLTSNNADFDFSSIEEVALAMADLVQEAISGQPRLQSGRPSVFLGGWSYGGVVSFACARLLEERGVHVCALLLMDAPLGQAGGRSLKADAVKGLRDAMGEELSDRVASHFRDCNRLLGQYHPAIGKPLMCPVFDVRPSDSAIDFLSATACRSLTRAFWSHIAIPGATHFSLVQSRYAKQVGTPPELLRFVRQSFATGSRRRSASEP